MPSQSSNKAEPTLALKPREDITRSLKQGYQWPQKWTCVQQNFFKKKNIGGMINDKAKGLPTPSVSVSVVLEYIVTLGNQSPPFPSVTMCSNTTQMVPLMLTFGVSIA